MKENFQSRVKEEQISAIVDFATENNFNSTPLLRLLNKIQDLTEEKD